MSCQILAARVSVDEGIPFVRGYAPRLAGKKSASLLFHTEEVVPGFAYNGRRPFPWLWEKVLPEALWYDDEVPPDLAVMIGVHRSEDGSPYHEPPRRFSNPEDVAEASKLIDAQNPRDLLAIHHRTGRFDARTGGRGPDFEREIFLKHFGNVQRCYQQAADAGEMMVFDMSN